MGPQIDNNVYTKESNNNVTKKNNYWEPNTHLLPNWSKLLKESAKNAKITRPLNAFVNINGNCGTPFASWRWRFFVFHLRWDDWILWAEHHALNWLNKSSSAFAKQHPWRSWRSSASRSNPSARITWRRPRLSTCIIQCRLSKCCCRGLICQY